MTTNIQEPSITIRDLLRDNWDNSNTSISSDPDIDTGWWDFNSDSPQVTLAGGEDSPVGGGQTGWSGINSVGDPVQEMDGSVQIDCWANRRSASVNPKTLVYEFAEEVRRIIYNNAKNPGNDLRFLKWMGRSNQPDVGGDPIRYRQRCLVGFDWFDEP